MHILRFTLTLMLATLAGLGLKAQEIIPDDPETTVGKLENGLTYYLRHNTENKGCADFYIIHNVGALQEEDNQNGLAHFLEHMAFNGTERYPDKTILNFLEKDGVRFGYNVNAYTSRTETVYNLSDVPLVRETFVDSVLFILHDWSCAISCEPEALDAERGVISEEWRRKDEPRALVAELQNNITYNGSKHTKRNVLGTHEIINTFKRQEILDFYEKWYRPDLQAIAIVGDIDVEEMEKRVHEIFSTIPAQTDPAQKEDYPIPAQNGPKFENMLHPMVKFNTLKVIHKQPYPPYGERNSESFYKDMVLRQVATEVLKERMNRATLKEDCPAKHASIVTNKLSTDFYTSMFTISPKSEDLQEEVLVFYATEVKRLLDHGFTEDELTAAKFQAAKRIRSNPDEQVKNSEWIKSCIEHFLRGEALISPTRKKEIQKMMSNEATHAEVSEYLHKMFRESEVIYSYSIEQGKTDILPSAERMKELLAQVEASEIPASYPEFRKIDFAASPEIGSIADKTTDADGSEIWKLSNGVKVIHMKTAPVRSSNHLVIKAVFDTGFRSLDQNRIEESRIASAYIDRNFGFRNYSHKDLRDSPESGDIYMMLSIDRSESTITIQCGKKDVEKAFQMLYLTLTEPYFDTEKALSRFKATQLKALDKEKSDRTVFDEDERKMRYCNHRWRQDITKEHYENIDMTFVHEVFRRSFGDIDGLKVYICDDLDNTTVQDYCNTYIASLKNDPNFEKAEKLESWPLYKGKQRHMRNHAKKAVPKSEVNICFKQEIKLTDKEYVIFDILDYIMNARCTAQIREERGGTYSVTFRTEIFPEGKIAESAIAFQTRPEMTDILVEDAHALINDMAKNGPTAQEFDNAVKYLTKRYHEQTAKKKDNISKQLDDLMKKDQYGLEKDANYLRILDKLNRKDIRKMAANLTKGDSMLSVYTEK